VPLALAGAIVHDSTRFEIFGAWTMASPRQGDLFRNDDDPEEGETPTWYPNPDEVRAELHNILAEARAAQTMPWDDRRVALYRTIFPQMTNCLPEEEGAQLRFEFEAELERLKAA
jgi:hypothetical protein